MPSFRYHRPESLEEAFRLKAGGARWIAGGTDLMVRIREGKQRPPALVSLSGIGALERVEVGDPTRLGAMTRVSDLLANAALIEAYPVLGQAGRRLGSVQIRNAATVGGNLCNASPCADLATPLLCLDARVKIAEPAGERELPLSDFFLAPGATRLAEDELVTEILFDAPPPGSAALFQKKGRVRMDIALASVTVLLCVRDGACTHARVAAGSVAPRPMRLPVTERLLIGSDLGPEVVAAAVEAARAEVAPITDVRATADYRRHLVGVFVGRAIGALTEGRKA